MYDRSSTGDCLLQQGWHQKLLTAVWVRMAPEKRKLGWIAHCSWQLGVGSLGVGQPHCFSGKAPLHFKSWGWTAPQIFLREDTPSLQILGLESTTFFLREGTPSLQILGLDSPTFFFKGRHPFTSNLGTGQAHKFFKGRHPFTSNLGVGEPHYFCKGRHPFTSNLGVGQPHKFF